MDTWVQWYPNNGPGLLEAFMGDVQKHTLPNSEGAPLPIQAYPYACALLKYELVRDAWLYLSTLKNCDPLIPLALGISALSKESLQFLRSEWVNHGTVPHESTLMQIHQITTSPNIIFHGDTLPLPVPCSYHSTCIESLNADVVMLELDGVPPNRKVEIYMEETCNKRSRGSYMGERVIPLSTIVGRIPNKSGRSSTTESTRRKAWEGDDKRDITSTFYDKCRNIQNPNFAVYWNYHPPLRIKYMFVDPECHAMCIPHRLDIPWECNLELMHQYWVQGNNLPIRAPKITWGCAIARALCDTRPLSPEMEHVRRRIKKGIQGFDIKHDYVLVTLGAWATFEPGHLQTPIRMQICWDLPLNVLFQCMQYWIQQPEFSKDPNRFWVWGVYLTRFNREVREDNVWTRHILQFLWDSLKSTLMGPSVTLLDALGKLCVECTHIPIYKLMNNSTGEWVVKQDEDMDQWRKDWNMIKRLKLKQTYYSHPWMGLNPTIIYPGPRPVVYDENTCLL